MNNITDQQDPLARRHTAEEVEATIAGVLGGWPQTGSPDLQDSALAASTRAESGTTCRGTGGVGAAAHPKADSSARVDSAEYERLVAIKAEIDPENTYIGRSLRTLGVFEQIAHFNRECDSPLLVLGPTGAGKTKICELIHKHSSRKNKLFRVEQASANKSQDATIIRARWVGHGRDSGLPNVPREGTGGLLQSCSGGTILIDEAGDLDEDFQTFLLQILDRSPIPPADGRGEPIVPDVRLIFATNQDIEAAVAEGRLRHDLVRRIRTRAIRIPPLNERLDDIFEFVRRMLVGRKVDHRVYLCLLRNDWAGNVGELLDVLRLARANAADGGRLTLEHMGHFSPEVVQQVRTVPDEECEREVYRFVEQVLINQGFEKGKGLQNRIANILGVSASSVTRLAGRYSGADDV